MLVGVAIFGIVGTVGVQLFRSQVRALASVDLRVEKISMQTLLLETVDCEATLPATLPAGCPSSYLSLKSGPGRVLAAANGDVGTKLGRFFVRGRCSDKALVIETKSVNPDPMTEEAPTWKSLYPAGLELCQSTFKTAAMPEPEVGADACTRYEEGKYEACLEFGVKNCKRKAMIPVRKCTRWEKRSKK